MNSASRSRLERLADFLPPGVVSLGVECRLQAGASDVDLGAAVRRRAGSLEQGALISAHPKLARALVSDSRWQAIARFGALWEDPKSAASTWSPFLFLEYDSDACNPPVPSVFAALDSPLGPAGSRGCPELVAARELAAALLDQRFDAEQSAWLGHCFLSLRDDARVLHLAVMLGRSVASLRLSIWIDRSTIGSYFERIGVPDAAEYSEPIFAVLPIDTQWCQIDFDIGPPVCRRIGLGYKPATRTQWHELIDHLVKRDLCDRHKAGALLAWPSWKGGALRRELSHVKLRCDTAGRIEAKCYLGATRGSAPAAATPDLPD